MNHRERVLATLNHREPDRVPRYAGLDREVVEEFRRRTGQMDPGKYWDWDFGSVGFRRPATPKINGKWSSPIPARAPAARKRGAAGRGKPN